MELVVRYGEIGTKSEPVRSRMLHTLRQRVEERLEYENIEFERVSRIPGRIVARKVSNDAVDRVGEMPGVSSCSPARTVKPEMDSIKEEVRKMEVADTFGVRVNTGGGQEMSSQQVEEEIGDFLSDGREVDLDDPGTWVRIDVRKDEAFIFTEQVEGPGGFPSGSEGSLAALISGGIDSPVAAFRMMVRGAEITPIYFYNRPVAAEDHLARFEAAVSELERFHPSRKWEYFLVDMEEINNKLKQVGKGKMIVHRRIMFGIAEKIAESEGLDGIVTGESLNQKSSQTSQNLKTTSEAVDIPVHRPLLGSNKNHITREARRIGSFQHSKVDSACRSIAPDDPSTSMSVDSAETLEKELDKTHLVDKAFESSERRLL
ncbi:MAG: tRNA sulfurtransferase [Candidatus Nanohaloarchaea archaeon]